MNVNVEPIIRGLKSDIFDCDQVQIPFHLCRSQWQKKKSGVKNVWKFVPLRGGGGGCPMANTILNFHFDYLNPSLRFVAVVCRGSSSRSNLVRRHTFQFLQQVPHPRNDYGHGQPFNQYWLQDDLNPSTRLLPF